MLTPERSLPAQKSLGKYQILRRLARGGMANVFLARVNGLQGFEKLLVIKQILPELASNPEFVEMFLDEARIAAQLQHTNIVQVYDIGSSRDAYYFSMEFLHGRDLRAVMKSVARTGDGYLPLEHALFITTSVCAGLHYAHEKVGFDGQHLGIVHRDMSPHNVFITYDGAVKILDFGIAKAQRRATATRAGTLKGKISYMAPEQCRSDPLDRRADVFSVGILMWEMLSGRRLFPGKSDFTIMKAICETDAPHPSSVRPCDPEMEAIVMRALRRREADRYQTAEDLLEDLESLARERKLKLSAHSLARFMGNLFADRVGPWESARSKGKSLGEHMLEVVPRKAAVRLGDGDLDGDDDGVGHDPTSVSTVVSGSQRGVAPATTTSMSKRTRPLSHLLTGFAVALLIAVVGVGLARLKMGTPNQRAIRAPLAATGAQGPTQGPTIESIPSPGGGGAAAPLPEPSAPVAPAPGPIEPPAAIPDRRHAPAMKRHPARRARPAVKAPAVAPRSTPAERAADSRHGKLAADSLDVE
jgi:serine/threonine protein kinase